MNDSLDDYCPCCRFDTFKGDRFIYSICPICFWEDDQISIENPNFIGGANNTSLDQARKNYAEFGACERKMVKNTRKPNKNDKRMF